MDTPNLIQIDHQATPDISRRLLMLLGLLFALMTADALITRFVVSNGLGREGNSLLGLWVTQDTFLMVKIAGSLLAGLILWDLHKRSPRMVLTITAIFTGLYSLIVLWNVIIAVMGVHSVY
jgi:hypothetical protein